MTDKGIMEVQRRVYASLVEDGVSSRAAEAVADRVERFARDVRKEELMAARARKNGKPLDAEVAA